MKPPIGKRIPSLWRSSALLLPFLGILAIAALEPALAEVSQRQEAPGQVLYQSRQALPDRGGRRWQVIALRRVYPDGQSEVYLRLEGVPGATQLARNQPLKLIVPGGQVLEAPDQSQKMFPHASPAPHLRQYDLQPILSKLDACKTLRLSVPAADGSRVEIGLSPAVLEEWHQIAGQKSILCP